MDILKDVDTWRRVAVPGLEGVSAEFRILSGPDYRALNTNGPTLLESEELQVKLCGAVRAIEGLEASGEPITELIDVIERAPPRVTARFLTGLYLAQYTEDDSGN